MSNVTRILTAIESGDANASEELLPLVYEELRRLASVKLTEEKPGQTLQATALVHEAYLRLVDVEQPQAWNGRGHFFAAASEAMRRILVENARRKQRVKRGGELDRKLIEFHELEATVEKEPAELLAIHEALDGLAAKSKRKAELVKLRYFLGCTIKEAAEVLGISPATAEDDWRYAKAWLRRWLSK